MSNPANCIDEFLARLRSKSATVAVMGLGYVGLPLSLTFAESGVRVIGFDTDPEKIAALRAGRTYLRQYSASRIFEATASGHFIPTGDFARLEEPDAIIICVPTPLATHLEPDLSYVRQTAETISRRLRQGQLVVLESTSYPGTTLEVVQPLLEKSGLIAHRDFYLAFSPEREDPGNLDHPTATIPKIVGADDEKSCRLACALYEMYGAQTVPVGSSMTAEAVKITENTFRAVNIALVNELKLIYSRMGINIWEVVEAAKSKPFGYMAFYPGPGLGGHCIPIDPFYLSWKAREFDMATRLIALAGEINTAMPDTVIDTLAVSLDARFCKGLNRARILIMGLAYKKNIDDIRESPALRIIDRLLRRGALVDFYDPYVSCIPSTREYPQLSGKRGIDWHDDCCANYDAVVITTDHDVVDYRGIAERAQLIIDTRNACAKAGATLSRVVNA